MAAGAKRKNLWAAGRRAVDKAVNARPSGSSKRSPVLSATPSFHCIYASKPTPSINYSPFVADDPGHILHERVKRRIAERDRNALWISVLPPLKVSQKATVRSWTKRRIAFALFEALKARGFDREGRVLADQNDVNETATQPGLKGSLKVVINSEAVTRQWSDIQGDVGKLVESLCQKSPVPGKSEDTAQERTQ